MGHVPWGGGEQIRHCTPPPWLRASIDIFYLLISTLTFGNSILIDPLSFHIMCLL